MSAGDGAGDSNVCTIINQSVSDLDIYTFTVPAGASNSQIG